VLERAANQSEFGLMKEKYPKPMLNSKKIAAMRPKSTSVHRLQKVAVRNDGPNQ